MDLPGKRRTLIHQQSLAKASLFLGEIDAHVQTRWEDHSGCSLPHWYVAASRPEFFRLARTIDSSNPPANAEAAKPAPARVVAPAPVAVERESKR